MIVRIKTKEQLLSEGWVENNRSVKKRISIDNGEIFYDQFFVGTMLGAEVTVVTGVEDHYRISTVTVKNRLLDRTDMVHPSLLDIDPKKLIPRKKVTYPELVCREDMTWDGLLFRVGCRTLTAEEALPVANWMLKQMKAKK